MSQCIMNGDPECDFSPGIYREQQLSYFCGNALECRQVGNQEALQSAKLNTEKKFALVGLTNDMERTIALLERIVPTYFKGAVELFNSELSSKVRRANRKSLTKANVNSYKGVTQEAKMKLRRQMALELDFYDFAKMLFDRQFASK